MRNVREIVEYTGYEMAAGGRQPNIINLYNTLRKAGLEVDIQTVGWAYKQVFDLSDPLFSSEDQVDDAIGYTFSKIIEKEEAGIRANEIGRDNPAVAASAAIAKMIYSDAVMPPTVQKLMQQRLIKAAKRILDLNKKGSENQTAEEILREVLLIENKNPHKLGTLDNAETLFREFKKEFSDLASVAGEPYQEAEIQQYAEMLEQAAYGFLLSGGEIRQIINNTLKDAGFTKVIKAAGQDREVVDWNKVHAAAADPETGTADFRDIIRKVYSEKGFTPREVERIVNQMESEFRAMQRLKAETALNRFGQERKKGVQMAAMNKLLHLYQISGFSGQTATQALMQVLGVNNVTAQQVGVLRNLMAQYNQAQQIPLSKWSPTFLKTLEREVEYQIEKIEEKDSKIWAIRHASFFNQFNSSLILANIQNIAENITSGMVEYFITAIRNPKQSIESLKVFGNTFADVVRGGVREGSEISNVFNASGNIEERYNWERAKTLPEKLGAGATTITRALLSSFDNAYKASITHLLTVNTIRKALVKQGLSNQEAAAVVNESYYGNRAQIEAVAKQLTDTLKAAGVKNVDAKWKRIAAELSMANLLSAGQFFQNILSSVAPGKTADLNEDLLKAIRDAAGAAAARGLGHQADVMVLSMIDQWTQTLGQKVTEARRQQDPNKLAAAEAKRAGYHLLNRFRSGAMRWMWLSVEKSSGLALLQTLVTDVLARRKSMPIDLEKIDLTNPDKMKLEDDLTKYLSLRQRLVRQTVVPLLSYTFGYKVILPMMLKVFADEVGGDTEDKKAKAYARLSAWLADDPGRRRWAIKALPIAVWNYLDEQSLEQGGKGIPVRNPSAPSWLDVIDPELLGHAFINNFNQSPIAKVYSEGKQESEQRGGDMGVPLGRFLGSTFNWTGLLRNIQINSDAIKVLNGQATKLTNKDHKQLQPEDFWDAFMYSQLDKGSYRAAEELRYPKKFKK